MIQAIKRHLKRSGLTRRNNSNKRKEDENDLENVTQCRPNEIDVGFNTTETVSVKLTNESSPQETVKNNNNNLININNQRNQHHLHADLSSLSSSSCPSPQSSCTDKRRRRGVVGGGNDNQSQPDQLITGDNLLLPSTHHDNNANQSTNCAQVNEHQQKPIDDQHDNLNSNTMTIDSDNHLSTSSLVNEAYRNECIQLRQRVRELEQQNRLLTLLLAEQLVNSSTNSVDNRSKLDKLMAINSLTNNLPQLISEYESTLLDNNSNHDEVSIMNSSPPGQGHLMNESKGITLTCESDYCGSMGNNHPDHHYHHHIFNNNNNHHDDGDETERSDRLVSMSKDNSMLGFNLTHVNIDRWRKIEEDKSKTKTTTTTQLTSQPNLPITNQLTSHSILPLTPISETINTINLEPLSSSSLSSVSYLDHQKKSSYINNLIENNSTLFTSTLSSSPTTSTLTTTTTTTTTITSLPSSSDPFTTTTITPTLTCTPGSTVSTSTLTALNSTLIGSPSSSLSLSPPQSPKKLITSSILDPNSSLFQSSNTVNCSPSLSSSNQLEKRILFILSSNNNNNHNHKYFNSTLSSSLSSSSSSSSSSSTSSSVSTDKINCDNRLINKPGNLALRTLSGSSSKSIVSLEKDSPASSATSFDSNGELTSKDEGYSTMSSDVQSDIGNNNNGSIVTINTTANSQSTTIPSKNESTINSILDDKQSATSSTTTTTTTTNEDNKTNRSFLILTSSSPPSHLTPSRTIKPPPPPPSGSAAGSSLSTLLHLKQQQQLKVETIEIKSEPKKMGVNGSPTNSIPLTFMSTVNPIVVGSSRLTTFKSSHQNDCLVTSSPLTTINNNRKNNKMELVCEKDSDLLIADTIKLNCNNNITTTTGIKNPSQSTVTTIKGDADDKSSNWLHSINNDNKEREENDSQSVNYCKNQIVNCDFIRKSRKSFNGKLSAHRYTFPPVVTRPVANTLDDIEWTPCLIYQPSKPPTDHQGDNLITDKNDRFSNCESSLITTAEKSTSADFDDDESRCLVNNREVIIYQDKRKRSGKNHHHHHMGKVEDDVNLDGKTNQLNQVKCDSVDWRSKIGRRKSAISKGSDCGSLMMKTVKDTTADDEDEYDDSDDGDEEEDEDEGKREKMKRNHKIDQKRKMKVYHKFPPAPESSSSSHGSQSLNRWHSDSQLYSDSMKQDKPPVEMRQVDVNCRSNCRFPRRHRDITNVSHPCQSFASTCKRSSGYIRRRIKREDRARIDESHRWSTLSTSSSALSDGLEAPIYCERRRYRPRVPMTITTTHIDSTGTGNLLPKTETGTGNSIHTMKYISSDENHSADDEDSAERFVSRWLHKSGGGLRWDDSEVTWKLNESLDWPEPIELENDNCLSSTSSPPSTSTSADKQQEGDGDDDDDDNQIIAHLNNDDTFEEIPLIDDDSSESEKIEITSTININNLNDRNSYSVLISPCVDEVGEVDVSHEGGGEGYISSDQASSVPDDGLTPETHFNGDFYRLCSVGSRTSLQQPDDEISLPPSSSGALSSLSSSSSPPLTDVKEQDEDEEDNQDDDVNYVDNETKIVLKQLTNSNDDELLIITTTTTSTNNSNNYNHQIQSSKSFDYNHDGTSLINSQSTSSSGQLSTVVKNVHSDENLTCTPDELQSTDSVNEMSISPMIMMINSLKSIQCLSSSSPDKSVISELIDKNTPTSTINTGLIKESQSPTDLKEIPEEKQLNKATIEQSVYLNDEHEVIKDNCPIYEEIIESTTIKPSTTTINCYPKPILIKSSSTNQTKLSPTRIPLPKQSNSLDAIKMNNNKDGFKLRFNSTTATTIDSITNNNVNNLISKSFINQHQVKRLNNNKMINSEGLKATTSSSSSLINKKVGTELKSFNKMMMEIKARMEKNNNQINHNRLFNRKLNESIPSIEEFERRLSEDKQMADKIREFYSIFEQSTSQLNSKTNLTTIPSSTTINSITSTIPTPIKGVKSNRSRSTISGDLIRGNNNNNKLTNNIEDIKSKLNYPKLLRSKGIGGMGNNSIGCGGSGPGIGGNNNPTGGNDSSKTMKEGHETSWVHVSGFNVGKVSETYHEKHQQLPPPLSTSTSPSPLSSAVITSTSVNCNRNLLNCSSKLSSDSGSSEDEFNLSNIKSNGGKKRSSFHQRLLALHKSRRQKKRASDCYMGMGFLPKIRASIVDRLDFYHRFGDKEQEALTSFNFLNDLPISSSSSSSSSLSSSTTTHSISKSSTSTCLILSTDCNFVQEQKLLLRCYLNSFQPLTTSSSSSSDLSSSYTQPPPPLVSHPPPSSSSSSSFKLSPYKWPQSPIKSTSSSPRYQQSVANNYILNHELTKRPVGGVS